MLMEKLVAAADRPGRDMTPNVNTARTMLVNRTAPFIATSCIGLYSHKDARVEKNVYREAAHMEIIRRTVGRVRHNFAAG